MASSAASLQDLDAQHHLHPFTHHDDLHSAGTHIIVSAEGCYVQDITGRKLLDGLAGLWCVNVGYGRTEIIEAITSQLREVCFYPSFLNSTTEPAIRLAHRLSELAPPALNHTIFCNSGSEANETALKMIRAYWKLRGQPQRHKVLSRTFSYHGVTLATTSLTGLPSCTEPFDLPLPGFIHVPGPHAYAAGREADPVAYGEWCLEETARIIEREGADTIGAMFVEPLQGAGGVIPPPAGYLDGLRRLLRQHGILLVADEVISGFGRLGSWFASELWKLEPDLVSLAKGLTSGYLPLGATMVSDEIAECLKRGGYLAHGFTYSGHPTACAAALANLRLIETDGLVPRVRADIGPYFQQKLRALSEHHAVGEVRGYGLIGALELVPRAGRGSGAAGPSLGTQAAALARKAGIIVRGLRDIVAISPPLTISHAEVDELFAGVRHALDRLWDEADAPRDQGLIKRRPHDGSMTVAP